MDPQKGGLFFGANMSVVLLPFLVVPPPGRAPGTCPRSWSQAAMRARAGSTPSFLPTGRQWPPSYDVFIPVIPR